MSGMSTENSISANGNLFCGRVSNAMNDCTYHEPGELNKSGVESMGKYVMHVGLALVTFGLGVAANTCVNVLANPIIEKEEALSDLARSVFVWQEPKLEPPFETRCGHLTVTVDDDRRLYLGSRAMGTLPDTGYLRASLEEAFAIRALYHAYRPDAETRLEIPEEERIERTVLIKAPRSLSYGEMVDLIEAVKEAGANPIGLVRGNPIPPA